MKSIQVFGPWSIEMERYRTLLDNQYEMSRLYKERKTDYKYKKQREEKRKWKAKSPQGDRRFASKT